jgi:hypothetical protein
MKQLMVYVFTIRVIIIYESVLERFSAVKTVRGARGLNFSVGNHRPGSWEIITRGSERSGRRSGRGAK